MFNVEFKPFDFQPTNMVYVMGEQELIDKLCYDFVNYLHQTYGEPVPVSVFEEEMKDWDIDYNLLSDHQKRTLDSIEVF